MLNVYNNTFKVAEVFCCQKNLMLLGACWSLYWRKAQTWSETKLQVTLGRTRKPSFCLISASLGLKRGNRNPATVYVSKYLRCLVSLRTSLPLFETRQQVNKQNGATHFWMDRWLVDRTQWGFDSLSAKDCFRDIIWSADGLASHFPLERALKALSFHYNKILWLVCFL